MATIEEKLRLLLKTKTDLMYALRSKGVDISPDTPFSEYDVAVKAVQGGDVLLVKTLEELAKTGNVGEGTLALVYDVDTDVFQGLFEFTDTWQVINNQLTADADTIAPGYVGFGHNGIVEGNFTNDATVQDNDMLYGKIAYAKGQRKVGSIEYKSTITADLTNKLGVSGVTSISDYRPDIGLAIGISSSFRGLYLYKINSDGSIGDLVETISIDSKYFYVSYKSASAYNSGIRDAKFMINDDDLDNVYIGFVSYCTFEGGSTYGHNWGFTSGALKLNKQSLSVIKTIEGKFVTHFNWNIYGGAYSGTMGIKIFPIKGNRAYVTACGSAYNGSDQGVRSRLMTIDDENSSISFLTWDALSYGDYMNVLASEDGRIVASFTDTSIKIQTFNEAFNSYSNVVSASDFGSYKPVMLRNTMYYKNQLYNNSGEVIYTYSSSPFESESSYKFYTMGYIIECLNGYAYIYQYDELNYTISFIRLIETGGVISVNRSVQDCRIMYFPVYTKHGLVLYNSNIGKYNVYIPKESYEKVTAMIRDGVYYTILDGSNATSDKLLSGYQAYSGNSLLQGTMPNNGELNYTPSTEEQIIPAGYTSGGVISAIDASIDENIKAENIKKDITVLGVTGTLKSGVMTEEEYTICDNLSNLILGDTPLIDDPNIQVTLDISSNDTFRIEDNTLVIEDNKPYTQISYIQSNNATNVKGQFINTKVKASNDIGFEIKLSTQECGTDYPAILYGGSSYTNGSDDEFGYVNRQNQHSVHYQNFKYTCRFNVVPYDQITEISFVNGVAKQDGEEIQFEGFNEIPEYTSSYDIYLFAANSSFSGLSTAYFSNAKIYYLKLYKGTQLIRDFIPVIRKSDNAVCLYDKVTKDFYTNGGSGSLIAGV